MNRIIKFRGKRIDNGEWVYGNYYIKAVHDEDRQAFDHLSFIKSPYGDHYEDNEVDPKTVGQFTGLTDKNGKEIFKGDIVKWSNKIYTIIWRNKIGGFIMQNNNFELVGNIYDNPELI